MQSAVEVSVNYAGERVQTLRFLERPTAALQANLQVTRDLLSALGLPKITDNQPSWAGIDPNLVIEFLSKFQVISQIAIDPRSVVDYIYEQLQNAELTRWRVLLSCAKEPRSDPLWTENLSVAGMPLVPLIARSRAEDHESDEH